MQITEKTLKTLEFDKIREMLADSVRALIDMFL